MIIRIEKPVRRGDMVSVNRRIAVFLAFYFDTIFALNELLRPGEKRMTAFAKERAQILPDSLTELTA